jgi:hypothetical protein
MPPESLKKLSFFQSHEISREFNGSVLKVQVSDGYAEAISLFCSFR